MAAQKPAAGATCWAITHTPGLYLARPTFPIYTDVTLTSLWGPCAHPPGTLTCIKILKFCS